MISVETKMGVLGGVSFSLIGQIQNTVVHTILLAALGATVSFFISRFLQWLIKVKDRK